jgi:hypothetical protein
MNILNLGQCMVMVAGFLFLIMAATDQGIFESAVSQPMTDNATDSTTMGADNMTAGAGNMTDANMTQVGNMSTCGNELN